MDIMHMQGFTKELPLLPQGKIEARQNKGTTLIIHKWHLITLIEDKQRMMWINYDWATFLKEIFSIFFPSMTQISNKYLSLILILL